MIPLRALVFVLPCLSAFAVALGGGIAVRSALETEGERALADGARLADLTARTLTALRDLPRVTEDLIGDRLVAEAALTEQLIAASELVKGDSVNARLAAAANAGGLAGILVTDGQGKALYRHKPTPDVTFAADGTPSPHGKAIGALIGGSPSPAAAPADRAPAGGAIVKQAAIRAAKGRLIQITADVSPIAGVAMASGGGRVVDDLLASKAATAVWLIGPDGRVIAQGSGDGAPADAEAPESVRDAARAAMDARTPQARHGLSGILAAAPLKGDGQPFGAVVIRREGAGGVLPPVGALLLLGATALAAAIAVYLLLRAAAARAEGPLRILTAAAKAMSTGRFNPFTLSELADRNDPAGEAARAFRTMAQDVSAREDGLEVKLLLAGQAPPP
jgi:HAMP domain-containing protein